VEAASPASAVAGRQLGRSFADLAQVRNVVNEEFSGAFNSLCAERLM
jgi:hypothetical protein